jgi:branched-chain amino acid transport system substrate-binding protein
LAYDTHALAVSTGGALVRTGGDTWFVITVDYAAGHALEKDTTDVIAAGGGKVLHPLNTPDFSSFLLQAQTSKAKIVALANAGKTLSIRSSNQLNSGLSPAASGSRHCC